jgi:hypothetical protein
LDLDPDPLVRGTNPHQNVSRFPNTGYLRLALEQDEDAVCVAIDDPGPPLRRVLDSFDSSLQRFSSLQATKVHKVDPVIVMSYF